MSKQPMKIEEAIIDFSSIPYIRELEERALYPYSQLNYLTGGMELGEISIIAGETGAGKTTLVTDIVSEIIKDEKVLCVYGESTIKKQQINAYRQMAGYGQSGFERVTYKRKGRKTNIFNYFVDKEAEEEIKRKTYKKLFYYDTKYGMSINKILEAIDFSYNKGGIKYYIIDNIMQIDTYTANEVKETKDNMEKLRRYVIDNKVHICLLAHYRKFSDNTTIRRRIEEIAGTSTIGNKCSTAMNIIRLDNIDKSLKPYKTLKNIVKYSGYDLDEASATIEILKTRHNKLGFVALKYDKLSNSYSECEIDKDFIEQNTPVLYKNLNELQELDEDLPF